MDDFVERLKKLAVTEELTREDLAEKIGIRFTRINNVMNRRGHIRVEEIEEIGNAFPEYSHWLAFGKEIPEAGQISPETEQTRKDYREQGKAG